MPGLVSGPVQYLRPLATGRRFVAIFFGFVAFTLAWFQFGPAASLTSTGVPLLDTQTAYTPEQAFRQLEAYGEIGRGQYQLFLLGDFLWIFLFGVTAAVLLLLALRAVGRDVTPWTWILVFPFAIVAFDWIENASLLLMTSRFPVRMDGLATLVPLVTTAKVMLTNVTFLLLLASVAAMALASMIRLRKRAA